MEQVLHWNKHMSPFRTILIKHAHTFIESTKTKANKGTKKELYIHRFPQ